MKPPFAYLSPTGTAFAAAIGISLVAFPLAGVGVQVEPTPLLPAIGAAAQRVAADLPATPHGRAPQEIGKGARSVKLTATRPQHSAPQRRVSSAPVKVVAPSVPGAPVTTTTSKGKAHRHGDRPALKSIPGAPARAAHGHAKKASTATALVPGAPKANGAGNGHKGDTR